MHCGWHCTKMHLHAEFSVQARSVALPLSLHLSFSRTLSSTSFTPLFTLSLSITPSPLVQTCCTCGTLIYNSPARIQLLNMTAWTSGQPHLDFPCRETDQLGHVYPLLTHWQGFASYGFLYEDRKAQVTRGSGVLQITAAETGVSTELLGCARTPLCFSSQVLFWSAATFMAWFLASPVLQLLPAELGLFTCLPAYVTVSNI